jgi:hypothetical protein
MPQRAGRRVNRTGCGELAGSFRSVHPSPKCGELAGSFRSVHPSPKKDAGPFEGVMASECKSPGESCKQTLRFSVVGAHAAFRQSPSRFRPSRLVGSVRCLIPRGPMTKRASHVSRTAPPIATRMVYSMPP